MPPLPLGTYTPFVMIPCSQTQLAFVKQHIATQVQVPMTVRFKAWSTCNRLAATELSTPPPCPFQTSRAPQSQKPLAAEVATSFPYGLCFCCFLSSRVCQRRTERPGSGLWRSYFFSNANAARSNVDTTRRRRATHAITFRCPAPTRGPSPPPPPLYARANLVRCPLFLLRLDVKTTSEKGDIPNNLGSQRREVGDREYTADANY